MKYDKKNMIENVSNKSKVGQIKNVKNGCKSFNQINRTSIGLTCDKIKKCQSELGWKQNGNAIRPKYNTLKSQKKFIAGSHKSFTAKSSNSFLSNILREGNWSSCVSIWLKSGLCFLHWAHVNIDVRLVKPLKSFLGLTPKIWSNFEVDEIHHFAAAYRGEVLLFSVSSKKVLSYFSAGCHQVLSDF